MEKLLHTALHVFSQSALQFFSVFGLALIGGGALTFLSRLTNNTFRQFLFPDFGMYVFGWIGVPVHEFCHAFFCKVFLHDVKDVKWFDPEGKGGAHGSVTHEYHPWNPYHRIGQFFIGLGPVLLGPCILAALFYFLVPMSQSLFHPTGVSFQAATQSAALIAKAIVNKTTLTSFGFYVFLYLAVAISSQMELSGADLKQALTGFIPLFLLFVAMNFVATAFNASWHHVVLQIGSSVMTVGIIIFLFAALLTTINLALCLFFMTLINRCFGREGINPFEM
jgi:hypothetical protein